MELVIFIVSAVEACFIAVFCKVSVYLYRRVSKTFIAAHGGVHILLMIQFFISFITLSCTV